MALQAMKGKAPVRGHHLIKQNRKISFFKKKTTDYFYINNPRVMVMKIKMEKKYTQNFISHQNVFFILFCLPTKILAHVHKHFYFQLHNHNLKQLFILNVKSNIIL